MKKLLSELLTTVVLSLIILGVIKLIGLNYTFWTAIGVFVFCSLWEIYYAYRENHDKKD